MKVVEQLQGFGLAKESFERGVPTWIGGEKGERKKGRLEQ